jgi:hypothetical protein
VPVEVRKNYFASVCHSKRENDRCNAESLLVLHNGADKRCYAIILVDGYMVKFQLDTRSTTNATGESCDVASKATIRPEAVAVEVGHVRPNSRNALSEADASENESRAGRQLLHRRNRNTCPPVDARRLLNIVRIANDNFSEAHESSSQLSRPAPTDKPVPMPRRHPAVPTVGRLTEVKIVEQYADAFNGRLGLLRKRGALRGGPEYPPGSDVAASSIRRSARSHRNRAAESGS